MVVVLVQRGCYVHGDMTNPFSIPGPCRRVDEFHFLALWLEKLSVGACISRESQDG